MSILSGLVGGSVAEPITAIGNVFDELFTNDEERAHGKFVLEKLAQQPHVLQAEINKIEAQHRSVFVAGWRPFIGWVCGVALAWHFILHGLLTWFFTVQGYTEKLPTLDGTEQLIPLVLALLGLGGLRTLEKVKGVSK